jgi:hypothetical protein
MDPQTFDLGIYSEPNFVRHRRPRLIVAIVGSWALAAIATFLIYAVYAAPPSEKIAAIIIGAIGLFVGYMCLSLVVIPLKYWGRPPEKLTVRPDGIEFLFQNGGPQTFSWTEKAGRVDVVIRAAAPGVPEVARVRMTVLNSNENRLAWRRVIPLTYLPESAATAVVASARFAGCRIEESDIERVISLLPRTPSHCYSIFPTFRLPGFHPYEYGTR